MKARLAQAKKAVAAFLGSTLTAVPIGLETGAKWWAALVPFITTLLVFLAPKNDPKL